MSFAERMRSAVARLRDRLMPFQREGVDFGLAAGGRVLIADEMGLGKTVQAIALAASFAEDWPLLVVCPASLRYVWAAELEKWLPELPVSAVHVATPSSFSVWSTRADSIWSSQRFAEFC